MKLQWRTANSFTARRECFSINGRTSRCQMDFRPQHFQNIVCWPKAQRHISTLKFLGRRRHIIRREISGGRGNSQGSLATQWALSPDRREFRRIHVIHEGTQCRSQQSSEAKCIPVAGQKTSVTFEKKTISLPIVFGILSVLLRSPTDGEEEPHGKNRGFATQHNLSLPDFTRVTEESNGKSSVQEETISKTQDCNDLGATLLPLSRFAPRTNSKVTALEIPSTDDMIEMFQDDELPPPVETPSGRYETAEEVLSDDEFMVSKQNLFEDQDQETDFEEVIPKEKIIQRINSQERAKSYQLARRLSFKWTTGAGPRIGCVRDYPSELQNRALEEMNLSPTPRSSVSSPRRDCPWSPRVSTPTKLCRETVAGKSPLAFEQVMLDQVATL
ncbi:hypothetical protein RHMOL_Rhmol04G0128900 [Rhododendron molle]|uniref:Uncharacterized protein n=1 Tax=Rhododendron molle TaxID=49168 RepID=A0ACC0P1X9_RHOML|nr:hypothetical protein RHMOL_Rhmol04G0128900 [Rhododendron molle]